MSLERFVELQTLPVESVSRFDRAVGMAYRAVKEEGRKMYANEPARRVPRRHQPSLVIGLLLSVSVLLILAGVTFRDWLLGWR